MFPTYHGHDPELNSANMLDVYRSDSQKSDSSQRPRVSFNRDVRIKKIGNPDTASIVEALAGDGEGHLVPTPVRREKIKASKRELALEADRVLKQADSVSSLHSGEPPRRQQRSKPDGGSLQRKTSFGGTDSKKWNSEGKLASYMSLDRPKNRIRKREQPPTWEEQRQGGQQYRSSTDLATTVAPPKRRSTALSGGGKLTRSVSDAGDRDKPLASGGTKDAKRSISLFGTIERIKTKIKKRPTAMLAAEPPRRTSSAIDRSAEPTAPPGPSPPPAPIRAKKQLSPIIESSPRDEYFKYSVGGPLDYGGASPPRPVRGHKVDRIVRKLQHQQKQQQAAAAELARRPTTTPPSPPPPSSPDFAHAEPFSYTATSSPTIVHLPDTTAAADRPPPPRRQRQQYRSAGGMDDTWTSYDDLSHRRDALESRLQKRAAVHVVRPQRTGAAQVMRVRTPQPEAAPDTYATVYKKNETLGGGDRYFERKIVTEHRFARRTPGLSGDGGDDDRDHEDDDGHHDDHRDDHRDVDHHMHHQRHRDSTARPPEGRPPTSRTSSGMPTIVSRNNVTVVNGPPRSGSVYTAAAADKPAKKRSRLDKFKMLFTGGGGSSASSKENKRPSPSAKAQYNSSDPESYTSSLRKRYNVFTGTDNNKHGNHVSGNRRMSSPSKSSKPTGNNTWFKSLDRFGKKNNKRSKTFTSGSENDDEIRVHMINDRNNSRGTTRSYHSVGNLNSLDMDQSPRLAADKRHSLIDSSAGSTTEGDSSQKSHKSTVYLHATTVGEIPESRQLHQSVFGAKSRRAASREELSSRNDAFGGAQKRTLSRSVSVLAPWAPRPGEGRTVDYDERGRPPRAPSSSSAARHGPVKATKSDPEESAAGASRHTSAARNRNRASSGEESSLLDEVIIRTTSRTGKLIKDDRATSRQIGRSMSSANRSAAGGTLTRIKTKS